MMMDQLIVTTVCVGGPVGELKTYFLIGGGGGGGGYLGEGFD
jgi:hypothetical protein